MQKTSERRNIFFNQKQEEAPEIQGVRYNFQITVTAPSLEDWKYYEKTIVIPEINIVSTTIDILSLEKKRCAMSVFERLFDEVLEKDIYKYINHEQN